MVEGQVYNISQLVSEHWFQWLRFLFHGGEQQEMVYTTTNVIRTLLC